VQRMIPPSLRHLGKLGGEVLVDQKGEVLKHEPWAVSFVL
jgi:hypothetical protein